jgi:signal recognition particle subunit SRP54
MFETLTERFTETFNKLTGRGRITEDNIKETGREVQVALLEADVALPVVKQIIADIYSAAIGQAVMQSLRPGEALIKIVHDKLVAILGDTQAEINLQTQPPAIILVAGLQGSGKTTTVAKLAKWLQETKQKSVLLASADVYRPAAIQQLETLAKQVGAHYFPSNTQQKPVDIAKAAVAHARIQFIDTVIIDTAGRLHIDDAMMAEIRAVHDAIQPIETLFVVDSLTGQDAANTARAFGDALPLTGVVLTKTDGDARGGAALSVRYITGKPIKFMGNGEKLDALEPFYPDRVASRILGMGDVLSLVEEVKRKVDEKQAKKLEKKLHKGAFDLEDFLEQLSQMRNMGGIASLLSKLPGASAQALKAGVDEKMFVRMEAMIYSMTRKERRFPAIINGSRKRRIATGSGVQIQDVNRLLKQFLQMQKTMKKFKGGNMAGMMQKLKGIMPNKF